MQKEHIASAFDRDLEAVQRLWASPVLIAMFDVPWAPMFFAAIFVFDPMLGWLSVAGGAILIVVTVMNQEPTVIQLLPISSET